MFVSVFKTLLTEFRDAAKVSKTDWMVYEYKKNVFPKWITFIKKRPSLKVATAFFNNLLSKSLQKVLDVFFYFSHPRMVPFRCHSLLFIGQFSLFQFMLQLFEPFYIGRYFASYHSLQIFQNFINLSHTCLFRGGRLRHPPSVRLQRYRFI